ncbi:class I SAM-dependent methyltransferase [Streptomyces sp. NPDC012769]|uniref:class I SAM-dependent methyltransferase n=1 Tax=Streptomyces sp. NPDC012769 TaxID=3364848 RepID=UPI00367918B0
MEKYHLPHFERWAPHYESSPLQSRYFRPVQQVVLRHVRHHVRGPARLLDVGCGTGALLRRMRGLLPLTHLHGVDVAPGMLRAARAIEGTAEDQQRSDAQPIRYALAAAEDLPYPPATFDVVTSTVSFHHWHDQRRGIEEMSRVLKPGGRLVIADHFAYGWMRPFFAAVRKRHMMRTHGEVDAMLKGAGLVPASWEVAHSLWPFLTGRTGTRPALAHFFPLVSLTTAHRP